MWQGKLSIMKNYILFLFLLIPFPSPSHPPSPFPPPHPPAQAVDLQASVKEKAEETTRDL